MTHFSQKQNRIIVRLAFILCLFCFNLSFADEVPMKRLNDFARKMNKLRVEVSGYPCNQNADLEEFYKWFYDSKLCDINMNNVGDPQQKSSYTLNTHEFENEVIDFFAPLYGFSPEEAWGFVTTSGTDGNNHGMYFGVRQILTQTKKLPIVYVSEDAHYSIKKLADLQNLELRQIKTDVAGKMIIKEFEKALDPSKPALVVIAMGTTFKGAIDNQAEIAAVLRKKKPLATYSLFAEMKSKYHKTASSLVFGRL